MRQCVGTLADRDFAVYKKRDAEYMLFVPNNDVLASTTETVAFVFKYIPSLKITSWSRYTGWNWSCACSSLLGRIFYMKGKKLYVQGAPEELIFADRIDDPDIDDPETGDAINWVWELPWSDLRERVKSKTTKYIKFDTQGTAQFLASMFIDNKYLDADNNLDPALSINFTGGSSPGFGGGDQPFGGGRRTSDERLWNWPTKFNIMKLRFEGATKKDLRFVAIALYYTIGSIRR